MNYEEYKKRVERQIKTNDIRERVIQDNIIRPFLQSVFPELDIEPVDVKVPSKIHKYEKYCGTRIDDKKGILGTPDLCIAEEWYWNNNEVDVNYRGVVEIKSPFLDNIATFEPDKKNKHTLNEISQYLNAEKNTKVILTDGITWIFYEKESGLCPANDTPICLGKLEYKYIQGRNNQLIKERSGSKPIVENITFNKTADEFNRLVKELKKFIGK